MSDYWTERERETYLQSALQVVSVVQTQAAAGFLELMRGQAFEGCLGRYRHEDGKRNGAMRQL